DVRLRPGPGAVLPAAQAAGPAVGGCTLSKRCRARGLLVPVPMSVSELRMGPTDKNWFEPQVLLAHFVIWGIPLLLTATCGGALEVQRHELNAKQQAAIEACTSEANAAARNQADRGEAFFTCMDHRPITQPTIERVKPAETAAG